MGLLPRDPVLSKPTKVLLIALVAAGGLFYGWLDRRAGEPLAAPEDAVPPGRWARAPAPGASDLTALLSLPYLQGKIEAGETSGVTVHDPERAYPGANLYCSGHAPEAILMDMQGRPLHRWRYLFEDAFPGRRPLQESLFFRRVALLPDGELLAMFQGTGLIKLDRDSNLVWAAPVAAFNDFFIEPDGRVLVLHKEARVIPEINPAEPVLEDFIAELTPDGELVGRASLLELFRRPPWDSLLAGMADAGDILHSNTVTRLEAAGGLDPGAAAPAAGETPFAAGNLLVSLRNVDVLGVLDASATRVLWGQRGPWAAQHEPVLLANGNLLLFDNMGGPGESTRVLEIEPSSGEIVWSYGEAEGEALVSPEGGTVARLPNGNTLITASESGRAIELDPSGRVVWEYLSPYRAGPQNELVASLWEVQRLAMDGLGWLEPPAP